MRENHAPFYLNLLKNCFHKEKKKEKEMEPSTPHTHFLILTQIYLSLYHRLKNALV